MKTIPTLAAIALVFSAVAASAQAPAVVAVQDKTQSSPRLNPVVERSEHLSERMVRDLRLNGYQATRLRTINSDVVTKMDAIERKNAGNPKLIDQECNGVCRERDQQLQAVLSNDQYSSYYGSRKVYYKYDKDFAAQNSEATFIKSVQNPNAVRANDAVIGPATTKPARPNGNLGQNAR